MTHILFRNNERDSERVVNVVIKMLSGTSHNFAQSYFHVLRGMVRIVCPIPVTTSERVVDRDLSGDYETGVIM